MLARILTHIYTLNQHHIHMLTYTYLFFEHNYFTTYYCTIPPQISTNVTSLDYLAIMVRYDISKKEAKL